MVGTHVVVDRFENQYQLMSHNRERGALDRPSLWRQQIALAAEQSSAHGCRAGLRGGEHHSRSGDFPAARAGVAVQRPDGFLPVVWACRPAVSPAGRLQHSRSLTVNVHLRDLF